MRIGEIIRYPAKIVKDLHVDGLRSWYSLTAVPDAPKTDTGSSTNANQ